jgi:hypothetical protein
LSFDEVGNNQLREFMLSNFYVHQVVVFPTERDVTFSLPNMEQFTSLNDAHTIFRLRDVAIQRSKLSAEELDTNMAWWSRYSSQDLVPINEERAVVVMKVGTLVEKFKHLRESDCVDAAARWLAIINSKVFHTDLRAPNVMAFPVTTDIVDGQLDELGDFLVEWSPSGSDGFLARDPESFQITSIPRRLHPDEDNEEGDGDGEDREVEEVHDEDEEHDRVEMENRGDEVIAAPATNASSEWWLIQPIDFDHAIIRQHVHENQEKITISDPAGPRYELICAVKKTDRIKKTNGSDFMWSHDCEKKMLDYGLHSPPSKRIDSTAK